MFVHAAGMRHAVVLAAAALMLLLVGCGEDLLDETAPTTRESDSLVFDEPVDRINIDSAAGDIEIVRSETGGVTVERTFRYSGDHRPDTTQSLSGGTLTLRANCSGRVRCAVDYVVGAPADVALDLDSASGDVSITDVVGAIEVNSASGNVRLAKVGGKIALHTASGSVRGSELLCSQLEVDSASGSIELALATEAEQVEIDSASGNVTLRVPGGPYRVDTDSASGAVTIDIATDPSATGRITVHTASGSIRLLPA